jgi:hypothetical protein
MRATCSLSCAALVILAAVAAAQDVAPTGRVRGVNDQARRLLAAGEQRSPTLRQLIAELDGHDLIVLVTVESPSTEVGGRYRGSTRLLGASHGQRFAAIWVDALMGWPRAIPLLAHELQHAVEVAREPSVDSQEQMIRLFSQIGRELRPRQFETAAAIDAEFLVRAEMSAQGSRLVTVGEELAQVDQYLAIEETRAADRLHVTRRIAADAVDALIPSLVLQPMIETSIGHGASRRMDVSRLELAIRREDDSLLVTVEDDGPGVPPGWDLSARCGRRLKSVMKRLEKLYPGSWTLTLQNLPDGGAVSLLRIPWRLRPAAGDVGLPAADHEGSAGR